MTGDCHARIRGSRGLRCPRRPDQKMFEAEAEGTLALAGFIYELSAASEEEQGYMALVLNAFNVRERGLGDTPPQ